MNKLNIFFQVWSHLTKKRKIQFFIILVIMVISSLAEVISIGAIMPFLSVLIAPEQIYNHELSQYFIRFLEIKETRQLLPFLTVFFISAVIAAGVIRLLLIYGYTSFSYKLGIDFSIEVYRRTLYKNYEEHLSQSSSEIINGVTHKVQSLISSLLLPSMTLASSFLLLLGIVTILLSIHWVIAVVSLVGFSTIYGTIILVSKKIIAKNSKTIAHNSTKITQYLQESLGGIRDILIDSSQELYCQEYRKTDIPLRSAAGNNLIIQQIPRHAIEALSMVLISILAFYLVQANNAVHSIPVLGALALGAQRLLPVMQSIYTSIIQIKGNLQNSIDVLKLLSQPITDSAAKTVPDKMPFKQAITLKNLSFRYKNSSQYIFNGVDLEIKKGERIGFLGPTGSGKSTLVDIIMSLLVPTNGYLLIDNQIVTIDNYRGWQKNIAHVPQNIHISDSTIQKNIAFGVDKIDHQRVITSAKQAQLEEFIEKLPNKYQTTVGERGAQLSGGQRQRIGIARALYKQADVLIFDEATSALDNATEQRIVKTIEGLDKELTILTIAHRLTTLKNCQRIIQVSNNGNLTILSDTQLH